MHKPVATRMIAQAVGSMMIICASNPIAPVAVKAAKAREWPTLPINRGAHQQPMKNPVKCADPRNPTSAVLKPSFKPDIASSGPKPPDDSCNRITDKNRAAKEMIRRMGLDVRVFGSVQNGAIREAGLGHYRHASVGFVYFRRRMPAIMRKSIWSPTSLG